MEAVVSDDGCDCCVVYGDPEHFANIAYLCGFDPRFEEALLVIGRDAELTLIVGNEGADYARISPLTFRFELAQSLSFPGQDRTLAPSLEVVLTRAGIAPGARVGVVGWKPFAASERSTGDYFAAPAYVIAALRSAVGPAGALVDVTGRLMDPGHGLRAVNSVDDLVRFEFRAARASHHVRCALDAVQAGMSEYELVEAMRLDGEPQTCQPMVSSGFDTYIGLRSPTARRLEHGDPLFVAMGLRGGLTARTGLLLAQPPQGSVHFDDHVLPYYCLTKCWYESVAVGVKAGEVWSRIEALTADLPFHLALNPGHLAGLEEWLHSPFSSGASTELRSGALLQSDMIPVGARPHLTANVEDTICLADSELRATLQARYPQVWERVQARRRFLMEELGIFPHDDVLPLATHPALFTPLLLSPDLALTFRGV
jgi:hypothetical protein